LGRAIALELAKRGDRFLILTARDRASLSDCEEQVREIWRSLRASRPLEVISLPADLADPAERVALIDRITSLGWPIETLINAAGAKVAGRFWDLDARDGQRLLEVNTSAPISLCRAFLPGMRARGAGQILNVCSFTAIAPVPYLAEYAATKSLLLSFSLALAAELQGSPIRVLAHCAGNMRRPGEADGGRWLPRRDPHAIAKRVLRALDRGQWIAVADWRAWIWFHVARLLPLRWLARVHRRALAPR
jgi:short-subunit dehydrogenase